MDNPLNEIDLAKWAGHNKKMKLSPCLKAFLFVVLFSTTTFAQKVSLKSSIDDLLDIKSVTITPILDNVSGIYSRPLTDRLSEAVTNDRKWQIKPFNIFGKWSPEEFEDNPEIVKKTLSSIGADSLITGRLVKGPNGVQIRLSLFLAKDGLLLLQEEKLNITAFETEDLGKEIEALFQNMKTKLPYSGQLLSRRGELVTFDLGAKDGVSDGDEVTVVQAIRIHRHPKYHFLVKTDKEIIGKIRVTKSEDSLSFGSILLERDEGVIQPGMKLDKISFVKYGDPGKGKDALAAQNLQKRNDSEIIIGDKPAEWTPLPQPHVGKASLMLGIASYAVNNTLSSAGAVGSEQFPTPNISFDGEIWLNNSWFMSGQMRQYIFSLSNSLGGSGPGKINVFSNQLALQIGHNFLLTENFFGPKFQILGGYGKLSSTVDTSTPTAYTSMNFSGFNIGGGGSLPIETEGSIYTIGTKFLYYLNAWVSENPVSSGDSSRATISSFSVYGIKPWTERMSLKIELSYDHYSASFSGRGTRAQSASSASHSITNVLFGAEYAF